MHLLARIKFRLLDEIVIIFGRAFRRFVLDDAIVMPKNFRGNAVWHHIIYICVK